MGHVPLQVPAPELQMFMTSFHVTVGDEEVQPGIRPAFLHMQSGELSVNVGVPVAELERIAGVMLEAHRHTVAKQNGSSIIVPHSLEDIRAINKKRPGGGK